MPRRVAPGRRSYGSGAIGTTTGLIVTKGKRLVLIAAICLLAGLSAEGRERNRRRSRRVGRVSRATRLVRLDRVVGGLKGPAVSQDVTGRVTLSDDISTLVVCPGMSTVLVNGKAVHAVGFVSTDEAGILIPEDLLTVVEELLKPAGRLRRVVIDPGHGGRDPGAIGRRGLREKDVNLSVALGLARILRGRGINVVLTRDSDIFVALDRRVEICNRERPDLFISIHANASKSNAVRGVETFFVRETIDDLARAMAARGMGVVEGVNLRKGDRYLGLALRHTVFDMSRARSVQIGAKVQERLHRELASPDRGLKGAGYRVLKGMLCPALLVEIGFLSNLETERKLRDPKYLDRIAGAISAGM